MPRDDPEERRRVDKATAIRLGNEFTLGDNIGYAWVRYSPTGSGTVILLSSGTVVTVALTISLAAAHYAVAAVILGLITIAGALGVRQSNRRTRAQQVRRWFCWYADGLIQTFPNEPTTRVLRWADVDSVTLTFNDADDSYNGLARCALDGGGTDVAMDSAFVKWAIRQVTDMAERILSPRLATALITTYDSGEPLIVGKWRIDQAGVTDNRRKSPVAVSWHDIREITVISEDYRGVVDPPSLIRITLSSGRKGPELSLSGVRNGMFLPQVLEHVAESRDIPVLRAVVPPGKGGL